MVNKSGLARQSLIARALDDDEYYVLGSLNLSAAFDIIKFKNTINH